MLEPKIFDPRFDLGFIPFFLSEADPAPAKQQLHKGYLHGGGWMDFPGFTLGEEDGRFFLAYPGDPKLKEVARMKLRDETISMFPHAIVVVIQPDLSFEVCRMD